VIELNSLISALSHYSVVIGALTHSAQVLSGGAEKVLDTFLVTGIFDVGVMGLTR
jgi:hypothetical protein